MSMSEEYAKEMHDSPAVLCCRLESNNVISHHNLEDPAIFDDLVASGLLNLEGCLKIEEVIGSTLTKTSDSLTPLTADLVDSVQAPVKEEAPKAEDKPKPDLPKPPKAVGVGAKKLRIKIGEGKNINIELPIGGAFGGAYEAAEEGPVAGAPAAPVSTEPKLVRSLTRKHYNITEVKRGAKTKIEGTTLFIRKGIEKEAVASQDLVLDLKIDIITKDKYHTFSNTIMDVQPIATKEGDSEVGSGITRVLDNVVMMVSGTDKNGVQIGEFGSSEGYLDENIL